MAYPKTAAALPLDEAAEAYIQNRERLARIEGARLGIEAAAHLCWQGNCKGKWCSPEAIRDLDPATVVQEK